MSSRVLSSSFFAAPSGTNIHFLRTGTGSGPLLVCLHGLGGSSDTFLPLLPSLSQTFDIILIDFPGFGKTRLSPQGEPLSIPQHVDDLHHLIASLQDSPGKTKGERVLLIGHSLGAIVALHYAARAPSTVRGLAVLGVVRAISHIPEARQRMLDLAANTREKGINFAADLALLSNFYQDQTGRVADPEIKLLVRCAVAASDPEAYAQTCEAMADPTHVDPDYGAIMGPTVLIVGDKDKISPVARSEGLRELLGGEAWVEVVKSGHQLILEDLDGVKHAITTLMDKIA